MVLKEEVGSNCMKVLWLDRFCDLNKEVLHVRRGDVKLQVLSPGEYSSTQI